MNGTGDWTSPELAQNAQELFALLETVRDRPVRDVLPPAEVRALFDGRLPENPEEFPAVLADTFADVVPNLVQWNHPGFMAYIANSSSGPGILAETLTAALNVNAMLWHTSPAASALEETVLRWLADMAGYPADAEGVLLSGASSATFTALAAARDAVPGLNIRERGLSGRSDLPAFRVYTSDQAHSSVDKAAIALGIGLDNVVRLPSDSGYRMDPRVLESAVAADRSNGFHPLAVVATVGTTAVAAFDPVPEIAAVCARHGMWLHVDGAYGGLWRTALGDVLPQVAAADSIVVNPHKSLFTPMHASALFCRRPGALANSFRLVPEILKTDNTGAPTDFMDRSLELGRSFKALKVWWVLRCFGRSGVVSRMTEMMRTADTLRARAAAEPGWEVPVTSPLPVVCLRFRPSAEADVAAVNARILERVNASGAGFLSHAVLRDGYVLRVVVGNIHTRSEDVDRVWEVLREAAALEEPAAQPSLAAVTRM